MSDREADLVMQWSLGVCSAVLGTEWLARELEGRRGLDYLMLAGDEDSIEAAAERALRLCRVNTLATHLLEARPVEGFEHFVADAQSRSLAEVVAELRAVLDMMSRGARVEILPRLDRVKTPDARMTMGGAEVFVEVKSKLERDIASYRTPTIANSLKKARKQLPADKPGLVYLQIPPAWGESLGIVRDVDGAIRSWLTQTGRVNGVVLLLERRIRPSRGGTTFVFANYVISNAHARYPLPPGVL